MMKNISVPEYVADEFNQPLSNRNYSPDLVDRSCQRVFRLIAHALEDFDESEWDVDEGRYTSKIPSGLPGLKRPAEPIGFVRVDNKFYIYAEERSRRDPVAIFRNGSLAAEYFVWFVSGGKRFIDWTLFLEMEP